MGGEGFISVLGGLIAGCLLGLVISFAIKLIGKRESLPGWPIMAFALLGGILPAALNL